MEEEEESLEEHKVQQREALQRQEPPGGVLRRPTGALSALAVQAVVDVCSAVVRARSSSQGTSRSPLCFSVTIRTRRHPLCHSTGTFGARWGGAHQTLPPQVSHCNR